MPDEISQWWQGQFEKHGYQAVGPGRTARSWIVHLSPTRRIEVAHRITGEFRFPALRYYFEHGEKIRTAKDLKLNFGKGSMFWYPGVDESGQVFLFCDLAFLPDPLTRELVSTKLEEAISATVVSKKPAKNSRRGAGS